MVSKVIRIAPQAGISCRAPAAARSLTARGPSAAGRPRHHAGPLRAVSVCLPAEYEGFSEEQVEFMERKRVQEGLPPLMGGSMPSVGGAVAPTYAPAPASGLPAEYAGYSEEQVAFMERKRAEQGLPPLAGGAGAAAAAAAPSSFSATSGSATASAPAEYDGFSQEQIDFMERMRAERGLPPLVAASGASTPSPVSTMNVSPATIPEEASSDCIKFEHAPLSYFAINKLSPKGPRKNVDHGDPHDFTRPLVKGPTSTGSWACSEGGWDSPSPRATTEWFIVLSGSGCVTDPDGTRHPFGPGDLVVLPKGWYGRWDITEFIHKVWVVREHADIPGASTTPVVVPVSELQTSTQAGKVRKDAVHGSPFTTSAVMYAEGDVKTGYWCCTPGSFTSEKNCREMFYVLEGVFFLTNADGSARRFGPGDTVVLPKGWKGHWDVIETVKKVWVTASE